jgi:hypothetical protein
MSKQLIQDLSVGIYLFCSIFYFYFFFMSPVLMRFKAWKGVASCVQAQQQDHKIESCVQAQQQDQEK